MDSVNTVDDYTKITFFGVKNFTRLKQDKYKTESKLNANSVNKNKYNSRMTIRI